MARILGVGLACLIVIGFVALAIDATTIHIVPDPSTFKIASYVAFPGERIHVELDAGWTPVRSTNPATAAPLGDNWFVAGAPGRATLAAHTLRCPECGLVTVLWQATVQVGAPGT